MEKSTQRTASQVSAANRIGGLAAKKRLGRKHYIINSLKRWEKAYKENGDTKKLAAVRKKLRSFAK